MKLSSELGDSIANVSDILSNKTKLKTLVGFDIKDSIVKIQFIDSPLEGEFEYIFNYQQKYFVKGRPESYLKEILEEELRMYIFKINQI